MTAYEPVPQAQSLLSHQPFRSPFSKPSGLAPVPGDGMGAVWIAAGPALNPDPAALFHPHEDSWQCPALVTVHLEAEIKLVAFVKLLMQIF